MLVRWSASAPSLTLGTPKMKPAQCRAARGLINWTRKDLSRAAGVGERAVSDFERGIRVSYDRTVRAMSHALQSAGVVFIDGNEPGVKLKRLDSPRPA